MNQRRNAIVIDRLLLHIFFKPPTNAVSLCVFDDFDKNIVFKPFYKRKIVSYILFIKTVQCPALFWKEMVNSILLIVIFVCNAPTVH